MSALHERFMISDSIGYTSVIDPKFKTNTINIRFIIPLSPDKAAVYSLASSMLTTSCRKYPSIAALNRKMNQLYGGTASIDVSKLGDFQIVTATFAALCNCYALEQEDILGELLGVMKDCLFDPDIKDGGFSPVEFAIKKKDLLDTIDADINNKRGYALRQCARLAYKNEPSAYSCSGERKDVENITPQQAYDAYKELLKTAAVEVFFVGPEDEPAVPEEIKNAFSAIERDGCSMPSFVNPSPLKDEVSSQTETMDVAQCKMVMAFKSDCDDLYAMLLMNMLYGVTPFSMLFANVREKLSLCYYCTSTYSETKRTMFVDCGVEKANIQTAKDEILRQLEAVAAGEFSDEILENTRLSVYNSIRGIGDSSSSYIRWYFNQLVRNEQNTTEEMVNIYEAIDRERIMKAAASLKLDSVYVMESSGEEANEDE
ncbi:MAG: insulinase family protein [Oscillospiraceae bacterium]|nr:insulinase family protein [Oscillospiraceae bacterium]